MKKKKKIKIVDTPKDFRAKSDTSNYELDKILAREKYY